jgi:tripartite-type tricarboxylate transporter receptor subunit TctC
MKIDHSRRRLALSLLLSPALLAVATGSQAQAYPVRPVTLIVPQAPGGTNDIIGRIFAKQLGQILGQPLIVENRPGAGGNIGTAAAARGPKDGYSLLFTVSSAMTINPALYPKKTLGFDPIQDFEPIGGIASVPNVLVVNPSFPAKDLNELIQILKESPGKYQYGSSGNGTLPHLLGELFKRSAGLDVLHIPYKGISPALTDAMSGQVPITFASLPSCAGYIKAGKLRALGVSSAGRSPLLPEVPAISETIKGFTGDLWIGLFAAAGTPAPIIRDLRSALMKVIETSEFRGSMATQGAEVMSGSHQQLAQLVREGIDSWTQVVTTSNIRVE